MRAWVVISFVFVLGCQGTAPEEDPGFQGAGITHGPILGHVTSTSARVWARARHGIVVQYQPVGTRMVDLIASQRPFGDVVGENSKSVQSDEPRASNDFTAVCELTGLKPDTEYHYIVYGPEERGNRYLNNPIGTFRTLPDSEALKNEEYNPRGLFNFSFEFACGNNQSPAHGLGPSLPTYDTLLKQVKGKVHFAILNGDWLYEEDRDYPAASWQKDVELEDSEVPEIVGLAPTITGVWENYKTYLARAANLSEWHRHVPSYFTFDDHEILNDVFGSGTAGYRNRRAVFRDIALEAWYDYLGWANPVELEQDIHFGRAKLTKGSDVLVDESADFTKIDLSKAANLHVHWGTKTAGVKDIDEGDTEGGDPNANVYDIVEVIDAHHVRVSPRASATGESSYSIGRQSYGTFKVGNCRYFLLDTRTNRQLHDIKNPNKKGLSMLGVKQREWLMNTMRKGDADFYFLVSSVNFMIPHVGGGGAAFDTKTKDDAWTVFLEERETLIDFWDTLKQPVLVLTGDLHNSFAIKISDNVWEFASGPHNSVNHRAEDEGMRPVNGPFQYGPRACDIRWSSTAMGDIPRAHRNFPHYCVIQVNNVFNNPKEPGEDRWIAYPRPHLVVQYYDGITGELKYAESIHAGK
ncbi:MAG: alkaline phosphatase D family protein [Planctomycetota bacterium]